MKDKISAAINALREIELSLCNPTLSDDARVKTVIRIADRHGVPYAVTSGRLSLTLVLN
jgi:hypothetical protein